MSERVSESAREETESDTETQNQRRACALSGASGLASINAIMDSLQ